MFYAGIYHRVSAYFDRFLTLKTIRNPWVFVPGVRESPDSALTLKGQFLKRIYGPEWAAVDSNGNVFVVDMGNNRIKKF
jgi:hypothetical protein